MKKNRREGHFSVVTTQIKLLALLLAIGLSGRFAIAVPPPGPATYTVTNTSDSGAGSFRAAVTSANGNPGSTVLYNNNLGSATLFESITLSANMTINGGTGNSLTGLPETNPLITITAGSISLGGLPLSFTMPTNGGNGSTGTSGMFGTVGTSGGSGGGAGGPGGTGGTGMNGTNGGSGAAGNNAVMISGDSVILSNLTSITGANGGNGGNGGAGGAGGNGGVGGTGGAGTNNEETTGGPGGAGGHGGNGGTGGNGGAGGNGADGGLGIKVTGQSATIINSGTIMGGNGGTAGQGGAGGAGGSGGTGGAGGMGGTGMPTNGLSGATGLNGATGFSGTAGLAGGSGIGGAAISFAGVSGTVINQGVIVGGFANGGAGAQANAVTFVNSNNTFEVDPGSHVSGNVVVLHEGPVSNNTIALGGTGTGTVNVGAIGTQFQGFDTFVKRGSSTWTLTGSTTFAGSTNIQAGTLIVASSSALGLGTATLSGGTVQTDNVNHVINVGSNFFQTGGTLSLNINGAPGSASNDQVHVNGTAALGGNLAINYTPGTVPPNQTTTYTVITTTGGVTSAGAGYTTPILFAGALKLTIAGMIVGNDFDVTLTSSQGQFIPLPGANYTSNQRAIACYFDQFDTTLASGPTLLLLQALDGVSVDPAALGSAFDQLVPTRFESFTGSTAVSNFSFWVQQLDEYIANHRDNSGNFIAGNGGFDASGLAVTNPEVDGSLQSISSRLLAWSPAATPGLLSDTGDPVLGGIAMKDTKSMSSLQMTDPWDVFITGNVVLAQDFSDPSAGIAGANSTTGAVQVGADYRFNQNFLLGLTFAYGQTYATLDTIGSNATVNTYSPGVYASYSNGGWYANGLGSYGFTNYNQNRHVAIGGFTGTATSSPGGDQFLTNVDGGYNFHKGNWTYGPTGGLQYMHLDVDGYTETGLPGANLTVGANSANSLRSLLGGRVAYEFHSGGMTFEPYFNASWQHEYLNQARGITTQFNGIGAGSFVVNTPNPSSNSAVSQLGLNTQFNNALMAFVDYTVQAGQSNYFGQSVQAGFKIGF